MIELKNINKAYGDKKIYNNFNLNIKKGKTTVILGESGSGKTTLMNVLMGFEDYEGEIYGLPDKISAVFQTNLLVPNLTVKENIKLVNKDADVEKLLSLVGLENNANDYIKSLSAGMQRRVAIIRALCVNAELYLMDEPFINLDLSLKNHLLGVIKNTLGEERTLVIITHDVKEACMLSDEIVVISEGEIIYHKENEGEQTEKEVYKLLLSLKKY